jgi:hypothetical protein
MKRLFKLGSPDTINLIFIVGMVNGQLKIYHNETSALGKPVDDDDDSPRRH